MVLGYDEPRPKAENYSNFLRKLIAGLEIFGRKDISLMIYGSYVRGDYVPGRSDIDAILVFPDDVVTDKENIMQISRILAVAQKDNNIPFQVSLADLRTMSDGRFNSYDPNFKAYFNEEGKILFGPDYRNGFKFELAEHSDQTAVRFNLRKARIGLLSSRRIMQKDYFKFLEEFNQTLNSVSRGSKQLLGIMDGKLRLNRFSALEDIAQFFPQINTDSLEKIKHLYENVDELNELYKNPDELIKVWKNSLTFFEQMIKAYLDANPRNKKI